MKNVQMLFEKMKELNYAIDNLLRFSTYTKYGDLSELQTEDNDAEELLMLDELSVMMGALNDISDKISYLARPVAEVGTLHRNQSGQYETSNGHVYSCGSNIEALVTDDYREAAYWAWSRVEHNGDYYIVGHKDVQLNGLTVRVREQK